MLNNLDNLISIKAAAKMLCVAPATLYMWASAGRVPHIRLGNRCIRFQVAQLIEFINNKSVSPAEIPPKPPTPSKPRRNGIRQGKGRDNKYLDVLLMQAKDDVLNNN